MIPTTQIYSCGIVEWCKDQTLELPGKVLDLARRVTHFILTLFHCRSDVEAPPLRRQVTPVPLREIVIAEIPIILPKMTPDTNSIHLIRHSLNKELPLLNALVLQYQNSQKITPEEYQHIYDQIMVDELGFTTDEAAKGVDTSEIFKRIRGKIRMSDCVFLAGERKPVNAEVFGYLLVEKNLTSFAIGSLTQTGKKFFRISQNGQVKDTKFITEEEMKKEYPTVIAVSTIEPIEINTKFAFVSRLPTHNGCTFEAVVSLMAYLISRTV